MIQSKWLLLAFLFLPIFAQAQKPCATAPQKSSWLTKFQLHPDAYALPESDTTLYIPLTIHFVGTDAGNGYFTFNSLLGSLCQLNADYEQANIQFYIEGSIHYINNSAYNIHGTVAEGAQMMFENDVENTLNLYFLDDPAGACGYNLPYASIAINEGCAIGSHTIAHEIGHAFTLPHPFLGWEGKTYMEGDTAPVKLTYDYTYFQDTLILDTLIIDTTFAELVDGSNCQYAADGFCDTPPDYLAYRWQCDADNTNGFLETDPTGETFSTNGELFMSYAADHCQSKFSDQQIAAMRTFVLQERSNFLYNQTPLPPLSLEPIVLISPAEEAVSDLNHTPLIWSSAGDSAIYHLVVSRSFTMAYPDIDTFVTDTTFLLTDLEIHNYYWTVRAHNNYSFCSPNSLQGKFKAAETVATFRELQKNWQVGPTFVKKGASIHFFGSEPLAADAKLSIVSLSGVQLQSAQLTQGQSHDELLLSEKCSQGMYFLIIQTADQLVLRQKIMVY